MAENALNDVAADTCFDALLAGESRKCVKKCGY